MASSHGSPATDQPVKLPARALALLDALDAIVRAQLEPPLSQAVTEAEQQLFHRAELSTNNNEQLQYLDSQRALKHRHDDIVAATLKTVLAARGRYGQAPPPRLGSASLGLELLAEQAQDENVAVDDLAARLESRAAIVLFELGHRLAVLAARPAFDAATQPYGPPTVCRALQDAVDTLDIPSAHRIEVFRAFERLAATRVVAFYETLNRHLAEQGILPQLRVFAPRRRQPGGSGGTAEADDQRAESPSPESARATTSATDATPPTATPRTVPAAPDVHASLASEDSPGSTDADAGNVFAALSELLAQRRRQLGPGIVHGSAYEPSNAELQQVLATLQTSPAEVRASGGGMRPRSMQQLRQDMLAQLRRNSPDASTPRLAAEHIDTMELMSMLFDRLVEDVQSSHGSQMLSQMQAPLLRVALDDKAFFTDRAHPARHWLNTLAEVTAKWGGDGEDADATLIEHMRAMVRQIAQQFDGDLGLFTNLSQDLQQQADTLQKRADVTERRHVEASKGRERLELARLRAEELVAARLQIRQNTTPSLTRNLLQHAWTDVLALSLLQEGEDSDGFRRQLAITDALTSDPATFKDKNIDGHRLRTDIEHGLSRVGMPASDAEVLAREAIGEPATAATDEVLTRTELAMKLKQRKRLGSASDEEIAAIAPPQLDPKEQAALAQLKTMPFGTWFDCDSDPPGGVVRRKLAWYSTKTGNCLLVNQRGARSDTIKLEQVARAMASGSMRVPPPQQGSLIDRALDSILSKLKALVGSEKPVGSAAT